MEKGDVIADVGPLVEMKGMEGEEKLVVGLHRSKESEGDEVFEEAVGTVIPEDRVVSDDKSSGEAGALSGSVEVNHTSDNGDEVEMFEEAIGVEEKDELLVSEVPSIAEGNQVPIEILNSERESGEKAEVLVSEMPTIEWANQAPEEIPNGVRESGENAEVLMSEVPPIEEANQATSESPNGIREPGETAELSVTGDSPIAEQDAPEEVLVNRGEEMKINGAEEDGEHETRPAANLDAAVETSNDKDEVGEISSEVPKKPSNGVVHHLNMYSIQDGIDTDKQEKHHHEQPETQDANEVKGGDTDSGQEVKSNGDIVHQDMMSIEVNEPSGVPDTVNQENKSIEEYSSASLTSKHQGDRNDEEIGDASNSAAEKTHDPQSQQPEHQGNWEEEEKDIPAVSAAMDDQHESGTLKGSIWSSVEEKSESLEVERSSITLVDSSPGERAKVPAVEKSPLNDNLSKEVSSSDSVVENSGNSQPKLASTNGGVSEVLVNQPERKAEKDEEAKQNIPSSRGVKPAVDSSTTVRSAPAPAARPAGLGRAAPLLEPAHRVVQQPRVNGSVSATQNQLVEEPINGEAEEYDETREKLQMIRVKFLRLAHRLGQTPHNVVVAQVLYRLGLAEQLRGRSGGRVAAFSFDRASAMAEQLEAAGQEPLDFSCTIMVLGKTGVGKSATINSIFDEVKFGTDAFQLGTKKVQDVIGTVQGIKVRVIDTPGLLPSWSDQRQNERILHSVKRFIKKTPPDIVLYLDRLDMQSRDFGDMPLLRTITDIFGPSIWFNAIVVLTHAASAPPEGPNGTATSYDMFVTQRSHAVQNAIRQAAGDMRLMNPVSLVENHSACRTNPAGQRVLPNGQVWKPHLLLLSFASKILAEANTLLKLQDSPPGRPFATRTRAPPLPFLLSSLLQSRPQVKLPTDQDDDDSLDDDLDESSDSEDESEYDQLPPFRSLTKAQLAKLPRDQRKAYYAELEYREKLFMKKQLKEEKKRRKMMKKMQAMAKDLPTDYNESAEEETAGAASVPVPMPDLALPASFDSDNPTHRYRSLDSSNQWLVRPVLEPNGWDHDVGYEGINVERLFVFRDKVPFSFSGQVSKDKKDTNLQMEVATSVKHGEGKTSSLGFDMQSVGKDIAYTLRGESRLINYRRNKATTGLSVTVLGDSVTGGVKVEDRLIVNKRGLVVVSGGAMFGRGDVAYGGSLEATLRDKDHPLGRFLSTLGLSIMDWHGDLAIGCNSQTQIPIGRHTNLIGRVNINNKGSGQVSIRLNSSEQLQIALVALIPFARKLLGYSQSAQFG